MNIVFWFLVFLAVFIIWSSLSWLYKPLGRYLNKEIRYIKKVHTKK